MTDHVPRLDDPGLDDPDLDRALRQHYAERRLADGRVEHILSEGRAITRRRWRPAWWTGVAAMLLLGLGGLSLQQQRVDLRHAVLAEVAMNHRKNLQAEVRATSYADVALALDRVDFSLAPATALVGSALTGGRYCSIQGQLAALLKLQIDGRRHTLYITPAADRLAGLTPYETTSDGVAIRLWTEGDRFFALAADAAR